MALALSACATHPVSALACPLDDDSAATALVRSDEELRARCSESLGGRVATDWETTALLPVTLDDAASIDRVVIRGAHATVHITRRPYCSGTPPPPPVVVFIEVPASVETSDRRARARGRCPPGPPAA